MSKRLLAGALALVMASSMLPGARAASETRHIATYVGQIPSVDGVVWDSDVTAERFANAYETVTITGNDGAVTATVEVVPEGLVYFIDSGTGPDWKAIMQGSSNSTDKSTNRTLVSGAYTAVKALLGEKLRNGESDQQYESEADGWGFLNGLSNGRPLALQSFPNNNSANGFTEGMTVEDKFSVGFRASTADNFSYCLTLEPGTYTLTTGFHEFYNGNHTRKMRPTVTDVKTGAVIAILDGVTMSNNADASAAPDLTSSGVFTLEDATTVQVHYAKTGGENGSMNWLAVTKGKLPVAANDTIPGATGGIQTDTDGRHIQAHGGQVQWLDDLDVYGDGSTIGGWVWYGEDKTRNGKPIDGIHCYASADLYNWVDKGMVLYTHDVVPVKDDGTGTGVVADTDALARLKAWAGLDAPTAEVTRTQINMAKDFLSAYRTDSGYDEDNLALAFDNLYSGYCIVERPKMLYNEKTGQYVLIYHVDGPEFADEGTPAKVIEYINALAGNPDAVYGGSRYGRARMGFAVSDSPYGPFKLVNVQRMNYVEGNYDKKTGMARDMNVFIDEGKDIDENGVPDAYAIYSSEENKYMYVSLLNADYTGPATEGTVDAMTVNGKEIQTFAARVLGEDQTNREAPALFTYGGYYYMITSGTSGWAPNQARYHRADNILGPYTAMGDPCVGDTAKTTFASQPTAVIPVDAASGKFIYMGDRWEQPTSDVSAQWYSSYVWLPIEIKSDNTIAIRSYAGWTLGELDKIAPLTVNTDLPQSVVQGGVLLLPETINVTVNGVTQDTGVTWNAEEVAAVGPSLGCFTVTGTLAALDERSITLDVYVVPEKVFYLVDCGATLSGFGQSALAHSPDTMVNKLAADQAYTQGNWGYLGANSVARGNTTNDPYQSLRYVNDTATGRDITYQFDSVKPGTYQVRVGLYDPWYSYSKGSRVANLSLLVNGVQEGETQTHTITGDYDVITFADLTLAELSNLQVLIAPKNSGSNTDVQVSWIAITGEADEPPAPTPITGSVTIHGTAKYGETLTAVTTAVEPEEATLAYQWSNGEDEAVGTESTYQIQASDIGKEITLTVTGAGDYMGSLTAATDAVAKADGPSAPDAGLFTVTDETSLNAKDGAIDGVTAEMEYSGNGGADWTAGDGSKIEGLAPGDYQVRYAETGTHQASGAVTLTVNAYGLVPEAVPTAEFNAADMTLSNVEAGMKYSLDGGENWVEITDPVVTLDEGAVSATNGIQVRRPGNGTTTSDSPVQAILLTQASQPAVSGEDESETETGAIAGTTEAMEYRKAGDTAWSGCAADATEVEPGVYEVRVKGAGTVLASEAVTVTVKAYEPPATNPVTGVRLDRESASLYVDDTLTLTATVEPAEADNRNVTWKSSDEGVATVDENGVVTAVSDGEAVITVTTEEGGFTAGCTVRVSTYTAPPYIPPVTKPEETDKSETVTNPDGSVTTTETDPETGAVTKTTEYPDGKTVETVTMPEGGKTVTVTGSEGEKLAEISLPAEIPAPETPFTDIPAGHWSEAAVNQVAGLGLFTGTGVGVFDGGAPMTRGMLTTVLHRLSGQAPGGENSFEDVPEDAWYSASIAWAARTEIVTGVSEGRFAPETEITRESLAVMLYRYAKLLGLDTDAEQEKPEGFTDSGDVSDWAAEAMAWAVERGILQGNGSALNPGATASRAEVAVMISRFVELMK